jgi:transcriptional regulator
MGSQSQPKPLFSSTNETGHWHGFGANPDVLAVFTGPNCSVKASWYLGLESGGTWNYVSVQAKGTVRLLDQPALVNVLKRLTAQVEGDANSGSNFEDLSDAYTSKMLPAIQAFEITVTNLDAIFKLSQNRDEASYDNVMEKLTERGGNSAAIAEMMLKRREKLFADS